MQDVFRIERHASGIDIFSEKIMVGNKDCYSDIKLQERAQYFSFVTLGLKFEKYIFQISKILSELFTFVLGPLVWSSL